MLGKSVSNHIETSPLLSNSDRDDESFVAEADYCGPILHDSSVMLVGIPPDISTAV